MRTAGCGNHSVDVGQALVLESGQRSGLSAAGVGQSSWASGSWAGAREGSPCRGGDSSLDTGSSAKAPAGTGAGGGGYSP